MYYDQMMSGGMWGMWLFGLILALVVLCMVALIKYLER